MARLTLKKRFEFFKPGEEVTTILIDGYTKINECEECSDRQHFYLVGEAVDKLAEYENAEESGLLFRLPCKIGSAVYALAPFCEICEEAFGNENACINCTNGNADFVTETKFDYEMIPMFGKKIFLNKAEAEAALQKMQEGSK